jgi:hypothetical protein
LVFERAHEFGFAANNRVFREFIPADAQAQLEGVYVKNSFELALTGLGEPIREVREALDPIDRGKRKEEKRHAEAMNRLKEQAAASQTAADNFNHILDFVDRVQHTNFDLDGDDEKQFKRNLISEMARTQLALGRNEYKVLEGPPPE